ncbi:MAG: hypothetical protein Q8Q12_01495 [bacterium]|nr:hypothetical protein [bacterium]
MVEYLPWAVGGLVVGFFVGYAFGRYKGASEAPGGLEPGSPSAGPGAEEGVEPSDADVVVYIRGGSGSHYHKEGCRHLRGRGYRIGKAQAIKKGYKPCPSCRP